jgi:hypothetical protein
LRTLPLTLPSAYAAKPGSATQTADVDVGGYDVMIGGHGFRLATDTTFSYTRTSEPTTVHRYDSSLEPGEQSLSPLPWLKSQASFHGGAGQLNLEQGFTAFQYQQEQVEHIRFDTSLGVDVWTPGQVTRLPDCRFFNFAFTAQSLVSATVSGTDYAIIGGVGGLYQASWPSGPDAAPVVTRIDLTGSTFVSNANCTVTSLCTDGVNYYGVLQMTSAGYVAGVLTYIISGQVNSTAQPNALYEVPNNSTGAVRHNLCLNPSFETDAANWSSSGTPTPTIARSTAQAFVGSASLLVTSTGAATFLPNANTTVTTVVGNTYTFSAYVYVPTGTPAVTIVAATATTTFGTSSTVNNAWQRVSVTFKATATSTQLQLQCQFTATAQTFYIDAALVEAGSAVNGYFDGSSAAGGGYTYTWDGTTNDSTSTGTAATLIAQTPGVVGWQKARLVGCMGRSLYELSPSDPLHSPMPQARYTHPSTNWSWTATSESPRGILAAGTLGNQSSILEFVLDTSGATPFLSGGASVAVLPVGEGILDLEAVVGSFLAVGSNKGIRVGTFDTYTGALKLGPLSINATQPVTAVSSRDRFVYGSFTNQQADGKTGLVRLDLSMVVDAAGRMAYAPDLRPPTTAPTGLGNVTGVAVLPTAGRMLFVTPEGLHIEGNGPGSDGDAWLRTSRIRYDTAEPKLFKLGRVHGTLNVANIQVTGIAPFQSDTNLGTFGFITAGDPGEFRLPAGLHEWIQLKFDLQGSACVLNSYQTKAYPAPARQHILLLTVNCFRNETDRFGLDVTDPETPRQRWQNLVDLETAGNEIRYVEFTNQGSIAQLVMIDQLEFKSFSRPNVEDDFGGYVTLKLRTTEG